MTSYFHISAHVSIAVCCLLLTAISKVSCLKITVGDGELVRLIRGLALQAWGPEVKSPAPTEKSKCGPMYIYNPRDVGVGTVTSLWLTGLKPSSRFSEMPCLKWMKLRETERRTPSIILWLPLLHGQAWIYSTYTTHTPCSHWGLGFCVEAREVVQLGNFNPWCLF